MIDQLNLLTYLRVIERNLKQNKMKKSMVFIALLLVSSVLVAQPGPRKEGHKKDRMENLTPEQRSEIRTKKMTLLLNLTDSQQKTAQSIVLEEEIQREEFKKVRENKKSLSDEEKFNQMNARLDSQIKIKRKWQALLSEEQFERFEKSLMQKHRKHRERHSKK